MTTERFPDRPIAATIAVVIRAGRVLLVRRANPPDAGCWGFPGGKIERGETLHQAALRELKEETGVNATALRTFTAVDAFDYAGDGRLRRQFVLVAVLCRWLGGEPVAGDDALEARWIDLETLAGANLALSMDVAGVAAQAAEILAEAQS
ncbi:MAG: ADP-ribose pyrophosphatase [Rhizobiaceae bacterium]|nr:ADP-ribose pyrophosphatase [Rhizobiaceae bacterium]